jgi:hypothetical protein
MTTEQLTALHALRQSMNDGLDIMKTIGPTEDEQANTILDELDLHLIAAILRCDWLLESKGETKV